MEEKQDFLELEQYEQLNTEQIIDYFINHQIAENGLLVTIDYLEFTVFTSKEPDADISGAEITAIEDILKLSTDQFVSLSVGMNGYPKRLKWAASTLFVLYGAGARQGVHVTLSGSACRAYVSNVDDLLYLILRIEQAGGKLTRLDLAVDDLESRFYSIAEIVECYEKREIISRWKTMERQFKSDIEGQVNVKECLYFGSMKSDCFLRVYNKSIEQMFREQRTIAEIAAVENPWVRWELVLRRDAALSVQKLIMQQMPLGEIWCGIMANYFRLVDASGDTNRSRWQTQKKWIHFTGTAAPLSIKMYPDKRDLSTIRQWLQVQVMPSLATLKNADESLEWIVSAIFGAEYRISPYHQGLIDAEKAKRNQQKK